MPADLVQLQPNDEHNQKLESHVHPPDWTNPTPSGRYNLVVIGAGAAGLITAAGAAGLGAKVALVERELLGGDCLNVGCVPSKSLISTARIAASVRRAGDFGVRIPDGVTLDFASVMARMRRLRAKISHVDSAARFSELGVDVYLGQGTFTGSDSIDVAGTALQFKKAVIATGARASAPPIPGLGQVDYLTNQSVFSLTELPRRLGVIGAGPIGCELAQAFANFGSEVFVIESTHGIMPREDQDASTIVKESLLRDGVKLICCSRELDIVKEPDGIHLRVSSHEKDHDIVVDKLLVAVGRSPNIDGLGLETVGVDYDDTGVNTNDRLQTTNPRIFAAGDICSPYKFTHVADFMARIVIQNALFPSPVNRAKASALTIPWCTYTSPELAHVGLGEQDAKDKGIEIDTFRQELSEVDRAILEGEDEGFVKVHVRKGTDEILGATIVAANAGDIIGEICLAITQRIGLKKIASAIHPYPTQGEAVRKIGDLFNRTRLTPFKRSILTKWLSWTR